MKYFWPVVVWSLLILGLSIGPGIQLPPSIWDLLSLDKWGHFTVYGLLALLLLRSFIKGMDWPARKAIIWAIVVSSVYGIVLEYMQYRFFPSRYFEYLDILANIMGSIAGSLLYKKYYLSSQTAY